MMTTSDFKDPSSGRSFNGRYDETLSCGCVVFYRGGTVRCEDHDSKRALQLEQELAALTAADTARQAHEGERDERRERYRLAEANYQQETKIVDEVWAALEIDHISQTGGKHIATLVSELRLQLQAAEVARAQLAALQERLAVMEWVLARAEEIVAYESGKTAAYAFTQAWTELPKELSAGLAAARAVGSDPL